jgi:ERCC4-related helicase
VRIAVDPRRSNLDATPDDLFLKTDGKIKKARERFRGKDDSLLVFVATDKLSEGLDFHEQCNRLVHFEYSPSPLRTIQREGRLFRILGDGKKRARKIHVAVPVFRGTRDELLVKVMRDRLEAFDMLLGGVREVTSEDEEAGASEAIRGEIVRRVRKKLLRGKRLAVN